MLCAEKITHTGKIAWNTSLKYSVRGKCRAFSVALLSTFSFHRTLKGPPLWSSGQSFWLQIQRSWVRFPALPDFLSGSGSGTGYTQLRKPREVN